MVYIFSDYTQSCVLYVKTMANHLKCLRNKNSVVVKKNMDIGFISHQFLMFLEVQS